MDNAAFSSGFYELPHTADVSLAVAGPTREELFINAARGMFYLMGIDQGNGPVKKIRIQLKEHDLESLLVSFLTELLYLIEKGLMVKNMQLEIENTIFTAQMEVIPMVNSQMEIKAVTFNNLNIERHGNMFTTQLVFDI